MLKRVLEVSSSVLMVAGMTPLPQKSNTDIAISKVSRSVTHNAQKTRSVAMSRPPSSEKLVQQLTVRNMREQIRLHEIHYAVSRSTVVPIWQSPHKTNVKATNKATTFQTVKRGSANPQSTRSSLASRGDDSPLGPSFAVGNKIASIALSFVGARYVWGGDSPNGFDCSGFAQYVYAKAGIVIPRTSYAQYGIGRPVALEQLEIGDLVFFSTDAPGASHVAIYIGNGLIVQSLNAGTGVIVSHLDTGYYQSHFVGARRLK